MSAPPPTPGGGEGGDGGEGAAAPAKSPRAWTGVDQRVQLRMDAADFRRVADVRREVWRGGLAGGVVGLSAGYLGYLGFRAAAAPPWLRPKHAALFALCGAAAGAYAGSVTRGVAAFDGIGDGAWAWGEQRGGGGFMLSGGGGGPRGESQVNALTRGLIGTHTHPPPRVQCGSGTRAARRTSKRRGPPGKRRRHLAPGRPEARSLASTPPPPVPPPRLGTFAGGDSTPVGSGAPPGGSAAAGAAYGRIHPTHPTHSARSMRRAPKPWEPGDAQSCRCRGVENNAHTPRRCERFPHK